MNFTFGIITSPGSEESLNKVFASIAEDECYDDVEVLVVGGNENKTFEHYRFIAFDETTKPKWITRKKNIITAEAKYDNIVYMHDYVALNPGWFKGMEEFGNNWDICMTPILNANGTRFRDWTLWFDDPMTDRNRLLPYDVTDLSKHMYISGAYWIAKRLVMEKYPLDGALVWGESEDVKWSKQVRKEYQFSINTHSSVRLLKMKDPVFELASPEKIKELQNANI